MIYLFYFLSVLLTLSILYFTKYKLSEKEDFSEKLTAPLWSYLLFIFVSFIPIINLIIYIGGIVAMIGAVKDEDLYYKKGWFIKLLTKEF